MQAKANRNLLLPFARQLGWKTWLYIESPLFLKTPGSSLTFQLLNTKAHVICWRAEDSFLHFVQCWCVSAAAYALCQCLLHTLQDNFKTHRQINIPLLKGHGLCYIIYFDVFRRRTVVTLHAIIFKATNAPQRQAHTGRYFKYDTFDSSGSIQLIILALTYTTKKK